MSISPIPGANPAVSRPPAFSAGKAFTPQPSAESSPAPVRFGNLLDPDNLMVAGSMGLMALFVGAQLVQRHRNDREQARLDAEIIARYQNAQSFDDKLAALKEARQRWNSDMKKFAAEEVANLPIYDSRQLRDAIFFAREMKTVETYYWNIELVAQESINTLISKHGRFLPEIEKQLRAAE